MKKTAGLWLEIDVVLCDANDHPWRGGYWKVKSAPVSESVTEAFRQHGAHHKLLKAAYTGVAASLIDGKTTHVIGGVSLSSGLASGETTLSNEAKAKLEMFWKQIKYG